MPLINCETSLNLTWSSTCVITSSSGEGKFAMTDTKLYVQVYQLKVMQNRLNNKNLVLKEQLTEINNKKINGKRKSIFRLVN